MELPPTRAYPHSVRTVDMLTGKWSFFGGRGQITLSGERSEMSNLYLINSAVRGVVFSDITFMGEGVVLSNGRVCSTISNRVASSKSYR